MMRDEYDEWAREHGESESIGEHERLIRFARGVEERKEEDEEDEDLRSVIMEE